MSSSVITTEYKVKQEKKENLEEGEIIDNVEKRLKNNISEHLPKFKTLEAKRTLSKSINYKHNNTITDNPKKQYCKFGFKCKNIQLYYSCKYIHLINELPCHKLLFHYVCNDKLCGFNHNFSKYEDTKKNSPYFINRFYGAFKEFFQKFSNSEKQLNTELLSPRQTSFKKRLTNKRISLSPKKSFNRESFENENLLSRTHSSHSRTRRSHRSYSRNRSRSRSRSNCSRFYKKEKYNQNDNKPSTNDIIYQKNISPLFKEMRLLTEEQIKFVITNEIKVLKMDGSNVFLYRDNIFKSLKTIFN